MYRRAAGRVGNYLVQFDFLGKVAEGRVVGGRTFPDTSMATLRMEGASLTHNQENLVLTTAQSPLDLVGASTVWLFRKWEPKRCFCCYERIRAALTYQSRKAKRCRANTGWGRIVDFTGEIGRTRAPPQREKNPVGCAPPAGRPVEFGGSITW